MRRALSSFFACLILAGAVYGQCPTAGLAGPGVACLDERLYFKNTSVNGTGYSWDFCSGEFVNTPTATPLVTNSNFFRSRSIRVAQDGVGWTGFTIDEVFNRLVRLDFGSALSAAPSVTNLGNPSGLLNGAYDFELYHEAGQWYALVANTASSHLLRISFGSTLQSLSLSVQDLGSFGALNFPNGIRLISENGILSAFVTNGGAPEVVRLDFGSSITNTPGVATFSVPGGGVLRGIDITRECDRWFGLVSSYDGKVFWLDFNTGLHQPPLTGQISFFTSYNFPSSLQIVRDGGSYFALIQSALGNLYRLSFGSSIIDKNGTGADLGNLSLSNENFALTLVKEGSDWHGYSIDLTSQRLAHIVFEGPCPASNPVAVGFIPPSISYATAGNYLVNLEASDATGALSSTSQMVTVSASPAPDVDFSIANACANNNIFFGAINLSGGINSYDWDFGDSGSSSVSTPSHVYGTSGAYEIELEVGSVNGCFNRVRKTHQVLSAPLASFSMPAVSPICTNQQYLFTNTSTFDPLSNPTWEWRLNGVLVSGAPELMTPFSSASSQEIRLKAIIPGCSSEQIQNIAAVLTGPVVGFSVIDDCASSVVPFTNGSTGVDAGFTWDFGDGTQSATASPNHQYVTPGTYTVTLTGSNIAGCQNVTTLPVKIYSLPQPDFAVGLPPFSCSGTPTPFQNNTPTLTDSNLQDWAWNFGDPASSTSTLSQPSFTYATSNNYSVQLTATSDAGCSNTVTKLVSIGASPLANFVFGPSCVNKPTQLTDTSTGGVQSRVWQVASSSYSTINPVHVFSIPGTYPVTLTVTGAGGCTGVSTQSLVVPVPPNLVLQTSNPCAGQVTIFSLMDASSPLVDAAVGWQWNIAGTPATGNPVEQAIAFAGSAPVSVISTHVSGCTYLLSSPVTILSSPVASFTSSTDRGEAPLSVQFQNTSTGASQYLWTFSGNTTGSSTSASPTYTFIDLGDYTAQLTATQSNGCSDTKIIPIHVLVATIDLEVTDFSLLPDAATGKLRATITVRNNGNVPVGTIEAALHLSSVAIVDENLTLDLDPGESATRTLSFAFSPDQLADDYVCAELISEKDIQPDNNRKCLSLDEGDFILPPYPNPSSGMVQIDWISAAPGSTRMTIYNSQGQRQYEWETSSAAGLNQSLHDLSFLAAGVYLITVQTPDAQGTIRFVRQ